MNATAMKLSRRLRVNAAISGTVALVALSAIMGNVAGCSTTGAPASSVSTVDLTATINASCAVATPQIATLSLIVPKMNDTQAKAFAAAETVVANVCNAPPTNQQAAIASIASILPTLAVLYATWQPTPVSAPASSASGAPAVSASK